MVSCVYVCRVVGARMEAKSTVILRIRIGLVWFLHRLLAWTKIISVGFLKRLLARLSGNGWHVWSLNRNRFWNQDDWSASSFELFNWKISRLAYSDGRLEPGYGGRIYGRKEILKLLDCRHLSMHFAEIGVIPYPDLTHGIHFMLSLGLLAKTLSW